MSPFFSIIIPVYNVEKYLVECLDSILGQDFSDFEMICVDDGSTDASSAILEEYRKKDPRVHVVTQKNSGQSVARNVGIINAHGKYLCFVDSDDMLVQGALNTLWNTACVNQDIQVVGYETAPLLFEDPEMPGNMDKERYYKMTGDYPRVRAGREFFVELMENDDFVDSAWLLMIDRAWLAEQRITFVPGAYFEDAVFALECYFAAQKMIHMKDRLYVYRVRENSTMTSKHTYQHEKWRIWQYGECMKHIYTSARNPREVAALAKYARQVMSNIKCIYDDLDMDDREKINGLTSLDGLIVESMGLNPAGAFNRDLALEGLLAVLGRKRNVLLYGAGLVGRKFQRLLKMEHLDDRICGFAVSSLAGKKMEMLNGIAVKNIEEYDPAQIDLLVISACNHHFEMTRTAEMLGFKEILLIDYNMEHAMDRRFLEQPCYS